MTDSTPIAAEGLRKTYRSLRRGVAVEALKGLTLNVPRSTIFGLLGPNGAGKTTFIKLLLGIIRPSGGTVRLAGRSPRTPLSRQSVGYLPEALEFPPSLRAGDMLDVLGRMDGLAGADRRRRSAEWLDAVGLAEWESHRIGTFSKGMKRRLGLAHALLRDPDIVILDEPTDGLDPVGQRQVRELLAELARRGKTVFLNSHQLTEVERVCTELAVLREGGLLWRGTVEELTRIEAAYSLQAEGIDDPAQYGLTPTAERGTYSVAGCSQEDLDQLLARLLSDGVSIRALRPAVRTLEASFLDLVEAHG